MFNWIESKEQQFPSEKQQLENFKRNGNNEYLGVVQQMQRKKEVLVTVPLSLWVHGKTGEYRWTICGSDEVTVPLRWALMPKPEGDWISTKDELPVAGVNVLATNGATIDMACRLSMTTFRKLVTHWMPLPKLPTIGE